MKARKIICLGMLLLAVPALSGCWLLAAGGAGAYGGYKASEKGYELRSPVVKERPAEPEDRN